MPPTSTPSSHPNVEQSENVPPYVLEYGQFCQSTLTKISPTDCIPSAPIVWLYSKEEYLPSDLAAQLTHTRPEKDGKPITGHASPLTLENLDTLNDGGKQDVYLTSNDDFTKDPAWLKGVRPDANGKTNGAVSCCIVVNDKGADVVDAFYCYFYAYNQGQIIFGKELGDHLGDW
jgi:hypothetical protein